MDKLLNSKQVAEYLSLEPVTVRRKALKGEIPATKIGHHFRFDKKEIKSWLIQNRPGRIVHILVIDDEPIIGQLFIDSLEKGNRQVTVASSSIEALGLVGNKHFDLIFLDLLIPELDGAELFRRIRQIDKQIPVVIITGYPDSEVMKRAMEHGPFMILKKPFTGDDIVSTVQIFVDRVTTRIGTAG
jgi:excisionase family DNA binding protein